jgi:hypothetical protein
MDFGGSAAEQAEQRFRQWRDGALLSGGAAEVHWPQTPAVHTWAGLMALVAFFSEACARRKRETANDPPSRDFASATRLGFRHLDPDELVADPDIGSGLRLLGTRAEAALDLARFLRAEDAAAGAMLRAFERATGSVRFGERSFTERRVVEAETFAKADAEALDRLALAAAEYGPILAEGFEHGAPAEQHAPSGSLGISEDTRRLLKRHRAAEPELEAIFGRPVEPVGDLGAVLLEGAVTVRVVAHAVREWRPEADVRRLHG